MEVPTSTTPPPPPIQPPKYGKLITVLSIDGGGIRGIIPGVILAFLEAQLQVISTFLTEILITKNLKLHTLTSMFPQLKYSCGF